METLPLMIFPDGNKISNHHRRHRQENRPAPSDVEFYDLPSSAAVPPTLLPFTALRRPPHRHDEREAPVAKPAFVPASKIIRFRFPAAAIRAPRRRPLLFSAPRFSRRAAAGVRTKAPIVS
jgi:hypothetical protein